MGKDKNGDSSHGLHVLGDNPCVGKDKSGDSTQCHTYGLHKEPFETMNESREISNSTELTCVYIYFKRVSTKTKHATITL